MTSSQRRSNYILIYEENNVKRQTLHKLRINFKLDANIGDYIVGTNTFWIFYEQEVP